MRKANVLGIEIRDARDARVAAQAISDEIALAVDEMSVLKLKRAYFATGVLQRELKKLIVTSEKPVVAA